MTKAEVTEVIFRLALLQTNLSKNSLGMHQVKTCCGFQHLSNNHQCYEHMDFLRTMCGTMENQSTIHLLVLFQLLTLSGERVRTFEFVDDADTKELSAVTSKSHHKEMC